MRNFSNKRSGKRDSRPGFRDSGRFRDSDRPERRDSGRFRDDDRRDFRKDVEMHTATCDKCGARCEVPFRPTGSRPIYCNNCFRKGENPEKSPDRKEFDMINEKLDRILEALGKD
ncbi:hypothetical protein HYX08_06655 [Candidatus Woesearchaeota archaeon]|nr:hypothetical protein [Candidatus Woesearchaeota archaeon]